MRERWCQFQKTVESWQTRVTPPDDATPAKAFDRSLEEVSELSEAIGNHDGTRKSEVEIGEEATDVIIRMLGLITIVNGNAAEMLDKKITVMQQKYPADIIQRQVQNGVPFETAMKEHKTIWQRKQGTQERTPKCFTARD